MTQSTNVYSPCHHHIEVEIDGNMQHLTNFILWSNFPGIWIATNRSLVDTFFVENHSGYFKPALFVRLVSVRGASKASEEGGMGRGRENGETGNLVVL